MIARAYVVLRVAEGKCAQAVQALRRMPGVLMVDLLEGPADVIMVVQASERQKLAELTVMALDSVEAVTEDVCLLPAQCCTGFQSPGRSREPNSN